MRKLSKHTIAFLVALPLVFVMFVSCSSSPKKVELVNAYKSPWRLMLRPDGGSEVVPSTGGEYVLREDELKKLIAAAEKVNRNLEPAREGSGVRSSTSAGNRQCWSRSR